MIPTYEECMLPLLQLASDGQVHRIPDAVALIADEFALSDGERRELLPSGKAPVIYSRVNWACVYLVQAKVLERPKRGNFMITQRGREYLAEKPTAITRDDLMRYEDFRVFLDKKTEPKTKASNSSVPEPSISPEEIIESSCQQLREDVAATLLATIKDCSPAFFENLVVDLLLAMGYGGSRIDAGQALGRSGDGGVDGIIKEDKLGLDVVYIQAKRCENSVGRPVVQAFAGALEGQRARKGVLITTSNFTADALDYVQRIDKKIVLIDGDRLTRLMMDHNVGVTQVAAYPVYRVDLDYFEQE